MIQSSSNFRFFSLLLLLILIVLMALPTTFGLLRGGITEGEEEQDRDLQLSPRIINGDIVDDPDKYPYFAEWNRQFCGGTYVIVVVVKFMM